ncbi:MAG: regulatory protein RecX [Alphaproteobacteria bacterium]|nr:MAG: regulatory protein RecX [Alphaproteobacteria bacterium]
MQSARKIEKKYKDKRPPKPRAITSEYLEKAALYYLGRYAASTHSLRQVLMRRLQKSGVHKEADFIAMVDKTIAKIAASGYLDDQNFAWHRIKNMNQGGKSLRSIRAKLKQKGIANDDTESALDRIIEEDPDMEYQAAMRFAKRKKLGPFAAPGLDAKKQLQKFAAAGFAFALAKQILNIKNGDFDDNDTD